MQRIVFLVSMLLSSVLTINVVTAGSAAAVTRSRKVCTTAARVGYARCHAIILTDDSGVTPLVSGTPKGYGPASFRAAYGVTGNGTAHIAIISAYDAPAIQTDVNIFSRSFGIPGLPPCSTASQTACFEKFNQRGTTTYPAVNSSWSVETSLDVESAHGMCPGCRISLYEASSSSISNLSAAADTAATHGATVISNSYGGPESASESAFDSSYHHPGVAVVVSSGDNGYGVNYPAASPYVVAVGGTTLQMNNSRLLSETAWSGSGSGCSQIEPKPSWQHDRSCGGRSVADVSADADPTTGAAIYDSLPNSGHSGWFTVGGTSLAAPLVAGILANTGAVTNQPANLYASTRIRDIIGGLNGACSNYLCRSISGYDGPTGLGVFNHL